MTSLGFDRVTCRTANYGAFELDPALVALLMHAAQINLSAWIVYTSNVSPSLAVHVFAELDETAAALFLFRLASPTAAMRTSALAGLETLYTQVVRVKSALFAYVSRSITSPVQWAL